jgi:hypothetical protein
LVSKGKDLVVWRRNPCRNWTAADALFGAPWVTKATSM